MAPVVPQRIDQLVGQKVKAYFDKKTVVSRLEYVDQNLGVLTLRTKGSLFFLPVDKVYLELPLK